MLDVTGSDHNLVTCQLHTGSIIRNFHVSARKRRDKPHTIYDYKSTFQNDWKIIDPPPNLSSRLTIYSITCC